MQTTNDIDEHDQDTPSKHRAAKRSTLVSVVVNIFLTITQIAAGIVSGSQGLIADGIHSLSDLVADFVVLFANHHSQKAPDADHHYGHQRYENAASLTLGALLLAVGVGMLWSAVLKLEQPALIQQVKIIALWVALGALVVKELLFRYMLAVGQQVRSSMLIQCLACALGCGGVAGGGRRHCRQSAGVSHARPAGGLDRGLHGDQNGLGICVGCVA